MKISSRRLKPVVTLVGSALMLSSGFALADTKGAGVFASTELSGGYLLAEKEAAEGKCGEGKCGGDSAAG